MHGLMARLGISHYQTASRRIQRDGSTTPPHVFADDVAVVQRALARENGKALAYVLFALIAVSKEDVCTFLTVFATTRRE
jgi:hypothetical protein